MGRVRFSLRTWLHIIGGGLGLLGVVFVLMRLSTYSEQIDLARFDAIAWLLISMLAVIYGAANVFLALAWWHLLSFFDVKVERKWALKAYGLSQMAKYVPGNICHLAGRQAIGMAVGLPARVLAKSALWELGLIALSCVFFAILALPLLWSQLPGWLSFGIFLLALLAVSVLLRRLLSFSVCDALFWQIIYLAVSGMVFIGILTVVVPSVAEIPGFSALCGAYVLAWLAGLVTPGAPAGVGVRELVLLFLLGGRIAEADLLLAVVLGRVVTVGGDLFYFIVATFLKLRRVAY